MPATSLCVPIKGANGTWSVRSWPADLRDLAKRLIAGRVPLAALRAGTEDSWIRPRAPTSPRSGTCVISNVGGSIDVSHQWFADVPPGDTEAVKYPIVHVYITLCIANLRAPAAREIARRLNISAGQYVIVDEAAIVGAILTAWGESDGEGQVRDDALSPILCRIELTCQLTTGVARVGR